MRLKCTTSRGAERRRAWVSGVITWPMAYARIRQTERDRARHDARAASECARAQTAHNHWSREAERPQFYGDRAGRDMFRARTRPDADSPTLRPINGRSTMRMPSADYK